MRLGKDVLELDLYGELGLLPDATASEIRVAYRHHIRSSHPDLNRSDPEALSRTKRLNTAAQVLLDPALRRAYDRAPRAAERASTPPRSAQRAWFERREQSADNQWASVAPSGPRPRFPRFSSELRGRDGQLSLQFQELVDSLSVRQQLGVAALLFVAAVGLIIMAQPQNLVDSDPQGASVDLGVYP